MSRVAARVARPAGVDNRAQVAVGSGQEPSPIPELWVAGVVTRRDDEDDSASGRLLSPTALKKGLRCYKLLLPGVYDVWLYASGTPKTFCCWKGVLEPC